MSFWRTILNQDADTAVDEDNEECFSDVDYVSHSEKEAYGLCDDSDDDIDECVVYKIKRFDDEYWSHGEGWGKELHAQLYYTKSSLIDALSNYDSFERLDDVEVVYCKIVPYNTVKGSECIKYDEFQSTNQKKRANGVYGFLYGVLSKGYYEDSISNKKINIDIDEQGWVNIDDLTNIEEVRISKHRIISALRLCTDKHSLEMDDNEICLRISGIWEPVKKSKKLDSKISRC